MHPLNQYCQTYGPWAESSLWKCSVQPTGLIAGNRKLGTWSGGSGLLQNAEFLGPSDWPLVIDSSRASEGIYSHNCLSQMLALSPLPPALVHAMAYLHQVVEVEPWLQLPACALCWSHPVPQAESSLHGTLWSRSILRHKASLTPLV